MGLMKEFKRGFWKDLPPFRLVLGICATLAVTKSADSGMGMGLAVLFVLVFSNVIISSIRKIIPNKVRIAAFIVVIATFVVIVELLSQAYFYSIYVALGIYLPLIVVNCILLGRAEAFASRNGVIVSAVDGLGIGIGYTIVLTGLGALREILGSGTVFGVHVMPVSYRFFTFILEAPGAFLCLGLILGLMNGIGRRVQK